MNLAIDLRSISDAQSVGSSNDFESYDLNEDSEEDLAEDDEEQEQEFCEFIARLRASLSSARYQQQEIQRNFDENYFETQADDEEHSFGRLKERVPACDCRSKVKNDLVCFYVTTVTSRRDLIKYFRPGNTNRSIRCDCTCSETEYTGVIAETFERLSLDERVVPAPDSDGTYFERDISDVKNNCELCERTSDIFRIRSVSTGRSSCRSSFSTAPSQREQVTEGHHRSNSKISHVRNPLGAFEPNRFDNQTQCCPPMALGEIFNDWKPATDEVTARPSSPKKHFTGKEELDDGDVVESDKLNGPYAASLASAARSARNLARDLDLILSTLKY
ncbi:hypothetical protein RUM43_010287 [Polyplax serrata]|uniref:Uncharacterized protein n=1 Tax=Polyplax serrata TaxID=468196 RepID=A0AAN8S9Y6_POLSC